MSYISELDHTYGPSLEKDAWDSSYFTYDNKIITKHPFKKSINLY